YHLKQLQKAPIWIAQTLKAQKARRYQNQRTLHTLFYLPTSQTQPAMPNHLLPIFTSKTSTLLMDTLRKPSWLMMIVVWKQKSRWTKAQLRILRLLKKH
ncbi:hypothetical protein LPJ79_005837, partial [Coemansia sp. RSA 1821]